MNNSQRVRSLILYTLRHRQTARFNELMKQSSLESDSFKFHIRALTEQGYIQKTPEGSYALTPSGKERANNLANGMLDRLKQPKLSLLIVLSRKRDAGETEYLVQQRLRHPFYGYWGCISGPVQWGDDFEATALEEVAKQCGISGIECHVHSFHRQKDYNTASDLLEDKLFIVIVASVAQNTTPIEWSYGRNEWMTFTDFTNKENTFDSSTKVLRLVNDRPIPPATFTSGETIYALADY